MTRPRTQQHQTSQPKRNAEEKSTGYRAPLRPGGMSMSQLQSAGI
jgi:hypothetical protein